MTATASQLDDLASEVGLGFVPEDRVKAQRFDVDVLPVDRRDPFRREDERRRRFALAAQPRSEFFAKSALSLRRDRDRARAIGAAYPVLRKTVRT